MVKKYPHAFFERGSWYHRTKDLKEDYTIKYGKKGGFKTAEEAEQSYRTYINQFETKRKSFLLKHSEDILFKEYLLFWFRSIFSERIESTTKSLSAYVLKKFLLPNIDETIKLRSVSTDYLNSVLKSTEKYCESAGNKSRELLYIAFKDAVVEGYFRTNPVTATRAYKRKKPQIKILTKEETKRMLMVARQRTWYLEILLALFVGLRKGEILALKFMDFDLDNRTVYICRQLVRDVCMEDDGITIKTQTLVERPPKTENSIRLLPVPKVIALELENRRLQINLLKERYKDNYLDNDYISCQKNGKPHSLSSVTADLKKTCILADVPVITVHGLRHMFATIALENGMELAKVSAMLGHKSVMTTFEFYMDIIDENDKKNKALNEEFPAE